MKRSLLKFIAVFSLITIAGCATTTKVVLTNHDGTYDGGVLKKVMVVADAKKAINRLRFENKIVKKLTENGIDAVSSAELIPLSKGLNREIIEGAIKNMGVDAVLVLSVFEPGKENAYNPSARATDPSDFHSAFSQDNLIGDADRDYFKYNPTTLRIRTALYVTETRRRIWTVITETTNPKSADKLLEPFSELIVKRLIGTELFE